MTARANRCLRRRRKSSRSSRPSAINNRRPLRSRVINLRSISRYTNSLCRRSRSPIRLRRSPYSRNNRLPRRHQPAAPAPQESLIHPLLMRNGDSRPLQKPTTPLPSLDLLTPPPSEVEPVDTFALEQMARLVEARLADFRIKADVVNYSPGPVITRFELNLAPGVKAARISNLSRDLARSLSTVAVRVVEVIPGKPYVGLELPNKNARPSTCVKCSTTPSSVITHLRSPWCWAKTSLAIR